MNVIRSLLPVVVVSVLAGCATAPTSPPSPVETAALAVLAPVLFPPSTISVVRATGSRQREPAVDDAQPGIAA